MTTPFAFGLWVLNELQILERQFATTESIEAAFAFRSSIYGVCYENYVVTCVNGDDPNHWLVPYLNARLPPLSERYIAPVLPPIFEPQQPIEQAPEEPLPPRESQLDMIKSILGNDPRWW